MGSAAVDQDELTVLVTGFGPFKEQFPENPSWLIASALPGHLPPAPSPKVSGASPATTTDTAAPPALPPVRILVHPEPIRVNYETVRALVPKLWSGGGAAGDGRRIDVAVHIGMASSRPQYNLELLGHRDGYALRDVDGKLLGDEERRAREGAAWVWAGCPEELTTDIDEEAVLARWRRYSPKGLDLRRSLDPGRYLCDFIYYSSLAHLWKAGERRRVVFLHVPADSSAGAVARGRDLVLQLIRSIVETELASGAASAFAPAAGGPG